MGYLIDFSLFVYDYIYINNEKCKFTYISDSKRYHEIIADFFKKMNKISINDKFINDLLNNNKVKEENNFHDIKSIHKEKIAYVLSEKNNDIDWLQQNIIDSYNIFQIKIIKPLFLDINHLIYPDKKKEKK